MNAKKIVEPADSHITTDQLLDVIFADRLKYTALLSAAMNHELHTPLIIIQGLAESLLRQPSDNPQSHLKEISREAKHLLKILDTMVFVNTGAPLKVRNLCLKNKVNQVIVFFEKLCLENGISLCIEVEEHLRVESEPFRLKSIMMALLQTAMESFEKSPKDVLKCITIHATQNKTELHLMISDTAHASPEEIPDQLGLKLAYKMAQDLNIKVKVISQKLKGTTFTLTFVH